jgi:hypothetical protein
LPNNIIIIPNDGSVYKRDGLYCMNEGSPAHNSFQYRLEVGENGWICTPDKENEDFKTLQDARGEYGKFPCREQLEANGCVRISGVGTTALVRGEFILKNGEEEEGIIVNTQKKKILDSAGNKKSILWASGISG